MASQHSNTRRLSKGRAQWRGDVGNHESAAVLNHYPNRMTPQLPREARPVSWKYGMSFSPSSSTRWPKSIKGQPQSSRPKKFGYSTIIIHLEAFWNFSAPFAHFNA